MLGHEGRWEEEEQVEREGDTAGCRGKKKKKQETE